MGKKSKSAKKQMAASTTHKLVGEFVVRWNLLESTLDNAIVALSKLDQVHGAIITANLNFQTKMHIVKTLIDLLGRTKPEAWREAAEKTIATIHTLNNQWRTLVVHYVIVPVDNKQVKFLKVSAKGKLNFPDTTRTRQQFQDVYGDLQTSWEAIDKIAKDLSTATTNALVKALSATPSLAPTFGLAPPTLGLADLGAYRFTGLGKGSGSGLGILGNLPPKGSSRQ
jgi:hypothetical protein